MRRSLELWGGVECTVNRVGDRWRDQLRLSGHHDRIDDLDRIAALGIRTLRYPILWERTELEPGVFDWRWADARMDRMRDLGIRPILGLIHHGAGPAWTSLTDDDGFAEGLARFAAAVAARYPWVNDWTPVNEPLTTARFSALYGHWHPHARDETIFWRALLNQIDGVRLSMQAIRAVIPGARLIQTEDFGVTYGTEACAEQVRHENLRRLATWDLLAGRVTRPHGLHARLSTFGLGARLERIAIEPAPADVIGLNHYATSDRFLDHRLERYRPERHGGNGVIRYADVEAVRVREVEDGGWGRLFDRLSARYSAPIAVTECHLGCSVDQQIRWLSDCWEAAQAARDRGVPVEAVTVWALLGSFDWNSLLTRADGHYERGAFDLSSGVPEPTALARAVAILAEDRGLEAGADLGAPIASEGWWRSADRFDAVPT
ncbi:family 1 glycosylhydrolase [Brevundimonas bacteroides]|uniref:family 1 glycosylhydrolase n=1 Tax=Brevundimonas bacteroides TaxID=74311 RepID=UPI00068E3E8B|nr:family 1 glycosylhydrolase [Brevundimonas bacteroides]